MGPRGARLEEIEAVYRSRLVELRRVATAITGSRETALDAVQDAFAQAVRQAGSYRGDGSLDAWLWRIVVNRARDHAAARRPLATAEPPDEAAAEPPDETLHALVAQLPERQRHALFLRYYADLDYATIANALEIEIGTVGATLSHAREGLRRLLVEAR